MYRIHPEMVGNMETGYNRQNGSTRVLRGIIQTFWVKLVGALFVIGNMKRINNIWDKITPMDQFIKNTLKAKKYLRYMDDFAIFSDDKEELTLFLYQINNFLVEYRLKLHKNKSFVRKISEGITFLGFVIYPDYILLHSKNLSIFRKRIKKQQYLLKNGKITRNEILQSLTAWNSHVKWGDTLKLRKKILNN